MNKVRVLGIDPGTNFMGFGVVLGGGPKPVLEDMGVVDLHSSGDAYEKLKCIFNHTNRLIDYYCPDRFAIEAQFFGVNVQSLLKLSRAQGVSVLAASLRGLPICEYAPLKVKQSITGNGLASKQQVASTLRQYLHIKSENMPSHLDATDAVAVALCNVWDQGQITPQGERFSSWADFAKKNDGRVK